MENKEKKMNVCKVFFPESEDSVVISGAVELVNHFNKKGLMLPVTIQDYTLLAKKGTLAVAQTLYGEVIGTAAYTQFYDNDIWEFGGWAVKEEHQHTQLGKNILKVLFNAEPHFKTIAFGNKNSAPIFEKMGAILIEDHSVLPKAAFDLCASCPAKPSVGCCDKIYNLAPVVEKLGMPSTRGMSIRQVDRLVYGIGENQSSTFAGLGKKPEDWK